MFVDRFCQKFAGEDTLSLLRCMAVANGSLSLDGTTISEIEAKRFIVSYQQPDTKPFDQWPNLTKEIHDRIEECNGNPKKIEYQIFQLHLPLQNVAAYFQSKPAAPKNQKAINAFFHCITSSIDKAHLLLEGLGFGDRANLGDYNHKWNKPSFHAVAHTGLALERYGNIIQGCLLENDIKTPLSEYERRCGIILTDTITADSLAKSMTWPLDLAHYYIQDGIVPEEDPEAAAVAVKAKTNFTEYQELLHALQSGLIDKTGRLLKPRAAFVRFCTEHKYFGGCLLNDWRPIDSLLTDSKGRPVTAEKLAQSYQDIMTKSVQ